MRYRSWDLLCSLHNGYSDPWLVLGDFNEIVALDEKMGREDRSLTQLAAFREALSDCCLNDLGFQGPEFTWSNRRTNDDLVRVRLDRGVSNSAWSTLFPHPWIAHMIVNNSDHMGLLLDTLLRPIVSNHRRHLFRFEHSWLKEDGCENTIQTAWDCHTNGTTLFRLAKKTKVPEFIYSNGAKPRSG